jgi:hypothetical protein
MDIGGGEVRIEINCEETTTLYHSKVNLDSGERVDLRTNATATLLPVTAR